MKYSIAFLSLCVYQLLTFEVSLAQEHQHDTSGKKVEPPKVFLDKSAKVVEYQLKRLSNAQLLSIEVKTDHSKYAPVFSTIATRPGMSSEQRETALKSLAEVTKKTLIQTLFEQLEKLSDSDREQLRVARELTVLLLSQPSNDLSATLANVSSKNPLVNQAAMAGLISSGRSDAAQKMASTDQALRINLLAAIPLVPNDSQRAAMRDYVIAQLSDDTPPNIRRQAIISFPSVGGDANDSFGRIAKLIAEPKLVDVAVQSLLKLDTSKVAPGLALDVATQLITKAEATPAAQRTTDQFIDLAQLVDRLLPRIEEQQSKSMRKRMQDIAVRVVRIKTVAEEMRYDVKHFVAAAGKPIQLILQNDDLMPHNLVVVQPGTLKEVALQAATMAPDAMTDGKQYVPAVPQVLFASKMIQSNKQERMTFTAPDTPGEYPFVCTYPNHWMRMYGVMIVVEDIDAYMQNPTEPKDPIGNNRSFVKNWKLSDFEGKLDSGLQGRSSEIGTRIFTEATCAQCHALAGKGGRVGPELAEVFKRHEQDAMSVLREIIDPSRKIDPKYASHSVLTLDGHVYSGVIVAEDEKTISLINNPDQPKPTVIQRSDIDEMIQSSKSIMPAALMDQFTMDEIFELLAYIKNSANGSNERK